MKLYEIDAAIASLVDPETGEILDYEAFEQLAMAREQKVENMALVLKNAQAKSAAIKAEVDKLEARKKVADNTVKRMKGYLEKILCGEKFETARVAISYRKSEATETDVEFVEWAMENCPEVVIPQPAKVDVTGLKKMLKDGLKCEYARIVEKQNVQVK